MDGITLITCTGMRAESIRRCARFVHRFDGIGDTRVQWVVVDDGEVQTFVPYMGDGAAIEERLVRPPHRWSPGANTLAMNLVAAMPYVKYDSVLFIEDDDWYHRGYMSAQAECLRTADIAGEVPARYYHVPSARWCEMMSPQHASLCATAIRRAHLHLLAHACAKSPGFIDVRLWQMTSHLRQSRSRAAHVVGIKGMPGRPGIGVGHKSYALIGWKPDPGHKLREWVGDDAGLYILPGNATADGPETA